MCVAQKKNNNDNFILFSSWNIQHFEKITQKLKSLQITTTKAQRINQSCDYRNSYTLPHPLSLTQVHCHTHYYSPKYMPHPSSLPALQVMCVVLQVKYMYIVYTLSTNMCSTMYMYYCTLTQQGRDQSTFVSVLVLTCIT